VPKGRESGADPSRKVGRENWKHWDAPTAVWQAHGESGKLAAVAGNDMNQELTSWHGPHGYTAEVEHREPVSGGEEHAIYVAGPFRTKARSQIAAESLGHRVSKARGGPYERSRHFWSHQELQHED
jgi:hypothetical protein